MAEPEAAPAPVEAAPVPGMLGPSGLPGNLPEYLIQSGAPTSSVRQPCSRPTFNRTQAAALLGIDVLRQLRYQMQKLEISAPDDNA